MSFNLYHLEFTPATCGNEHLADAAKLDILTGHNFNYTGSDPPLSCVALCQREAFKKRFLSDCFLLGWHAQCTRDANRSGSIEGANRRIKL